MSSRYYIIMDKTGLTAPLRLTPELNRLLAKLQTKIDDSERKLVYDAINKIRTNQQPSNINIGAN